MPQRKDTPFEAWEFSDAERPLAFVFTDLQLKHIKTEMAVIAQERLKLSYDVHAVNAQNKFVQELEYLRGKIEILQFLIECHENARDGLVEALANSADTQSQG